MELDGKAAIVTGGASGIGLATVKALLDKGAKVAVADINVEGGEKAVKKFQGHGAQAIFIEFDASREDSVANLVSETVSQFGRIDIMVNNAGIRALSKTHELAYEDYRRIIAVNQDGVFFGAKYAIREMLKSGGFGWWWHTTEDTLDKLDQENLRRDCQVYVSVIYDACTRKVLPLNHAEGARELKKALEYYAELAEGRLELGVALERVERLEQLGEEINRIIQQSDWRDEDAKKFNQQMLEISHHLIPLNYVSGDRYDHDLAMNQPVLPLLKDIAVLAGTSPGSDEELEWQTVLKRRLNKVEYTLLQAIKAAESLVT